jgi:hypothetical protein
LCAELSSDGYVHRKFGKRVWDPVFNVRLGRGPRAHAGAEPAPAIPQRQQPPSKTGAAEVPTATLATAIGSPPTTDTQKARRVNASLSSN